LFGPELIENKKNVKVMKMTQTTVKYPKYDNNILVGTKSTETKQVLKDNAKQTKSTETKQVLKDNAKQTHYSKTKPDYGT
jgi:hypothetical protein